MLIKNQSLQAIPGRRLQDEIGDVEPRGRIHATPRRDATRRDATPKREPAVERHAVESSTARVRSGPRNRTAGARGRPLSSKLFGPPLADSRIRTGS